jgi:hypothetical protein
MPADVSNVKELFLAVLELPAAERAAYLDTACAGDTALRGQVEAMLRSHANSGELLPRSPAEMLQSAASDTDVSGVAAPPADPGATVIDPGQAKSEQLAFLTPSAKPGLLGQLGPYEVQKVLGQGGFGIVLKAFDERLHRVVAIKVLAPAYAAVGSARKRFSRETRAAAAVTNEHVVVIHDVQGDADPPYFVMEFVDGNSLQDKIDKVGPLGVTEILRIGMQIALGLDAAHKQGLVHRDIKPANILLENSVERVKITDFGLARAVDDASLTQSGTVAGTPMYMSPEQAEGLPIDHRSDLFSLGTVLYAMCTGHPPFRAGGTHAVLKRVIEASPRPIREVNSEVPDWLADIIARLHARKPDDRFQTAAEVAELLRQRLADVQAGRAIERQAGPRQLPVAFANAANVFGVAWGVAICVLLAGSFGTIAWLLADSNSWDVRTTLLAGLATFSACAILLAAVTAVLNRTRLRDWSRPLHYAAVGCAVLAIGCAIAWLRHLRSEAPAKLDLQFRHPTARVVLENDSIGRREYAREKPGHGNTIVDLPTGAYQLSVFVADQLVESEELVLMSGQRLEKPIEPKGRLQLANESDEPVTVYGLVEPGTQLPPDEKTLASITSEVVGPRSAIVDSKWAGVYRWVRGNEGGECLVRPGQTVALTIPKKGEPGWAPLFNGKNLTGWVPWGEKGFDPKRTFLTDGNVLLVEGRQEHCFLRTEKPYENYEMRFEFRVPPLQKETGGCMLYLHLQPDEIDGSPVSIEPSGKGFIWPRQAAPGAHFKPKEKPRRPGEWNEVVVTSKGNEIAVRFNAEDLGNAKCKPGAPGKGFIAIVAVANEVHYRNIQIRPLATGAPAFQPLFNGKDLTGWVAHVGKSDMPADPAKVWEANGNLIIGKTGFGPSYLRTEKAYQNFHLKLEYRCPPGARGSAGISILGAGPDKIWPKSLQVDLTGNNAFTNFELTSIKYGGFQLPAGGKGGEWWPLEITARDGVFEFSSRGVALGKVEKKEGHQGFIGFFSNNREIHFRNVAIKEPPAKDGWVQLFNGKDLDGWTNAKKNLDAWRVENGVLIGAGDNAFLRGQDGPYADFHLRMEAKYVGGTAGLVFREQSLEVAGAGYVCSMENNKDGDFNTGAISRMHTKNLMGTFAVPRQAVTQNDKWFTLEVIANGNRLQTFVDGKQTVNFVDIHHDFKEGFIALTVRGPEGQLHVKKIEIKELPPEERGWLQLFNGTDLNGWGKPRYDAKWEVVDGVLTGTARADKNGMLPSLAKALTNFHLKAQARVSKDGNAGVIFRSNRDGAYLVEFGGDKAGSLFQLAPFKQLVDKGVRVPAGQWFTLDLVADGKRVTTRINGVVVADYADAAAAAGSIEVEVDAGPSGAPASVEFRSIEVKELPDPKPKPGGKKDAHARDAAVQFFKTFTARNLDALLKQTDVPFCREGDGGNIRDREELKKFLQKALAVRDPSKDTLTLKRVTTLTNLEGSVTDAERKALAEALGPDHRIVMVEWNRAGEGNHRMLILVRFEKGEARIVGLL